jgi:nitrous oxidase accessory protein
MYSHDTVLTENVLTGNSVGIYLMYSNHITLKDNQLTNNRGASGYGIGLKDCDDITVIGNALLANRVGAYIDNSPSSIGSTGLFESNMIAFNEVGLLATPNTHDNVFTRNAFVENEEPAATHGRGQLDANLFAKDGIGNYWSDYAGFDLDNDGIGDLAYEPKSLFGAMLAREPNLRLFVHSPAQRAVEFTARALPELRPKATLTDPAPLASPPDIHLVGTPRRSPTMMVCFALVLVALGGGLAALLARSPSLGTPSQGATT